MSETNGTTEQNLDKMLTIVRGLLAKADSTEFQEEADTFRAKADELMTKYAIEMWQLEVQKDPNKRTYRPMKKMADISWWVNAQIERDSRTGLWSIYQSVARHCRIKLVSQHQGWYDRPGEAKKGYQMMLIGMPNDLMYFDLLFTHLYVQLAEAMDPRPKSGESLESALVRMKEAGFKWEDCHKRLRLAGLVPDEPWSKAVASKMDFAGKYTRYCQRVGKPRNKTTPAIYRRSFLQGFTEELRKRLRDQVEDRASYGGNALALRDIWDTVLEEYYNMFPDERPHPADCDCDDCHYQKCNDQDCQRPRCKEYWKNYKKQRRRVAPRSLGFDYSVYARGQQAGRDVTIVSDAGQLKKQGELK